MKKIKQFFVNMRASLPKHAQWVLAGIGVVLCVMLIILLTGNKKNTAQKTDGPGAALGISPKSVEFGGTGAEQKITVSTGAPTVISSVNFETNVAGLSLKQTCTTMGRINKDLPCEITLSWNPESDGGGKTALNIKYYGESAGRDMEKLETVNILYAGKAAAAKESADEKIDKAPAAPAERNVEREGGDSVGEPSGPAEPAADEPEDPSFYDELPLDDEESGDDPEYEEPEPAPEPEKPAKRIELPAPTPMPKPETDDYVSAPEECHHFAFAGYNGAGKQIGWIKPENGRYMFHPFSDANCDSPTGEYNQKTGFVMDLKNPSKKIGSDAEHIGGSRGGADLAMPVLSNPQPARQIHRAVQLDDPQPSTGSQHILSAPEPQNPRQPSSLHDQATISSRPYDRTFVLRHFKPIPATIVNEIRAIENHSILPVMATVDRHVYSDNGRTIVVPAGTLLLGNVQGDMPGPYKTIGRINIEWYRFVRPDGVEFNFMKEKPFSGDSQGRVGVPGYGSSDYLEQMVMPLLTAIVPAATNLISPVSDKIVNQIDLDNNVVVLSGTMRSSEMAKQEMIKSWNKVTEKLFIDMLDNTKPPFSIASGTRITVYSPTDLVVAWCDGDKCTPTEPSNDYAPATQQAYTVGKSDPASLMGQVSAYIDGTNSKINDFRLQQMMDGFKQYQSKQMAANDAYQQQVSKAGGIIKSDGSVLKQGTKEYNQEVLGIKYQEVSDKNGNTTELMVNPNAAPIGGGAAPEPEPAADEVLLCDGGIPPDGDGCCPGETLTDMGADGMNCCPDAGGDCFPPIE